jgi:hypothetical protein
MSADDPTPPPDAQQPPAPGEAAAPPPDSTPGAESRAEPPARPPHPSRGARAWRVVRCPRWHARADAHAPQRDVYVWLSTRRATPAASRPTSPDPHAR